MEYDAPAKWLGGKYRWLLLLPGFSSLREPGGVALSFSTRSRLRALAIMFLALYVRLTYDRRLPLGSRLGLHRHSPNGTSVFLCGCPVESFAEAEELARGLVRSVHESARGFTMPRVFEFSEAESFLDVCDRAEEWYEAKVIEMNNTDVIVSGRSFLERIEQGLG